MDSAERKIKIRIEDQNLNLYGLISSIRLMAYQGFETLIIVQDSKDDSLYEITTDKYQMILDILEGNDLSHLLTVITE